MDPCVSHILPKAKLYKLYKWSCQKPITDDAYSLLEAQVHQIQLPKTAPFSCIRICFGFRLTTEFWTIYVNMLFLHTHTHTQNTSFWVWGSQFYIFLVRKCSCDYFPISSQPCPHQATNCWFIYNTQSRQPRSMLPKNVSILDRDSWVSFH